MSTRTFVDDYQTPHTDKLHVTERFHLIDGGKTLEVNLHVEDPGAFTMPGTPSSVTGASSPAWPKQTGPGKRCNLGSRSCGPVAGRELRESNISYFGNDKMPIPQAAKRISEGIAREELRQAGDRLVQEILERLHGELLGFVRRADRERYALGFDEASGHHRRIFLGVGGVMVEQRAPRCPDVLDPALRLHIVGGVVELGQGGLALRALQRSHRADRDHILAGERHMQLAILSPLKSFGMVRLFSREGRARAERGGNFGRRPAACRRALRLARPGQRRRPMNAAPSARFV